MPGSDERLAAEILAQFTDAASSHFDAALASMTSLSDAERRELKYWQRQSLAALREFAAGALPGALAAVSAAQQDALASVESAARTWAAAGPPTVPRSEEPVAGPDPLELRRRSVAARLASGA